MHRPVTIINDYAPIAKAMQLLLDHNIHRLPIVEVGKLVGIITRHNFLKLITA